MLFTTIRCLLCGNESDEEESWTNLFAKASEYITCEPCRKRLKRVDGSQCGICGRPFLGYDEKFRVGELCGDCHRWEQDVEWAGVLTRNRSLYVYNDFLKEVIARFKYRGDYILAKVFSELAAEEIRKLKPDILVPIPLSPERMYERGFNQAEAIVRESGLRYEMLIARDHGEKQSKKSREARIHLPQVFRLVENPVCTGKNILLIDDIYTTGSTLRHAAKLLKGEGACQIMSLTIARG
ncbi:ComF family protein [Neobacillus piezotolerans]|uniref:ComF family protein n=1 Tax=Neobacillus piezotolerans TaxID=2259171 RepID=A0A3D8GT03_9BACI|nr:ComF family protein [Neobacillus piezotolerans]RDU37593.1 ComF family protein [Neobacillus piezotolerans]